MIFFHYTSLSHRNHQRMLGEKLVSCKLNFNSLENSFWKPLTGAITKICISTQTDTLSQPNWRAQEANHTSFLLLPFSTPFVDKVG